MKRSLILVLLSGLGAAPALRADIKLPAIFSKHMVVQAETAVPVWGWADPGEEVTVTFADQTRNTKAGADGKWTVTLGKLKASAETKVLTAKGHNTLTVDDVLVGEVWLASGQSNMALQVNRAENAEAEAAAANFPAIRMFTVRSGATDEPQADCAGAWQVCEPKTVPLFSAAAYFFGRDLHQKLGVPVGLINSSVGGTPIESWTSLAAQERVAELKPYLEQVQKLDAISNSDAAKAKYERALAAWKDVAAKAKETGQTPPAAPRDPAATRAKRGGPGGLFNGKIAPLVPYALRGAIWYQGEANSAPTKAPFYHLQLAALIGDWRARWGSELPFAWVQLPNFDGGTGRDWPQMREEMLRTLQVPKTGMAITIDLGEPKDIHPKYKQEVGHRLALWALGSVYGQKVASTSGPLPAGHQIKGSEVTLSFSHADGGLTAKGGGELKGFVISGVDGTWKPAQARIEGNTVIVTGEGVKQPVAVRYAWENNPECNLTNGAGLPASPFRTDTGKPVETAAH
jgi:sialate O-acetylesterase